MLSVLGVHYFSKFPWLLLSILITENRRAVCSLVVILGPCPTVFAMSCAVAPLGLRLAVHCSFVP